MQADGSFACEYGMLTPAEMQLCQRQFVEFDVDGDQSISRRDFGEAMCRNDRKWLEPRRQAKLDSMYAAVDLDGDGRVSFLDFAVMRVRKKHGMTTPRGGSKTPRGGAPSSSVAIVYLTGCARGIGLGLNARNVITELPPGGAAARSGQLQLGDQVVGVDGVPLAGRPSCSHVRSGERLRRLQAQASAHTAGPVAPARPSPTATAARSFGFHGTQATRLCATSCGPQTRTPSRCCAGQAAAARRLGRRRTLARLPTRRALTRATPGGWAADRRPVCR